MIGQSPEELQLVAMRTALSVLSEPQKEIAKLYERDVLMFFDEILTEINEKHSKHKTEYTVSVLIGAMESLLKIKDSFEK